MIHITYVILNWHVHFVFCVPGIQEGSECTRCKNDWALRAAIALLYVLCALLTIAVAILGYKGECICIPRFLHLKQSLCNTREVAEQKCCQCCFDFLRHPGVHAGPFCCLASNAYQMTTQRVPTALLP